MNKFSRKILLRHVSQYFNQPRVNAVDDRERNSDGQLTIRQFSPSVFIVWPDRRWFVFGQREFESAKCVDVAVGYVMDRLPQRPTLGPVRCIKLLVIQSLHRGRQSTETLVVSTIRAHRA